MKFSFKALLSVAAVAAVAIMAAPVAEAQCAPAQGFASVGSAMLGLVQVEIGGALTGTELGKFWDANNSNFGNNFGGGCPPTGDWLVSRTSGNRGVNGGISAGTCVANSCPALTTEMTFLIEDYGPSGPPGVGDTAFFIGFRMDATPASNRIWDLGLAGGGGPNLIVLPWMQYPDVDVLTSNRAPGVVNTNQQYADLGLNFYGANAGGAIPDTASIVSWDVCEFHGPGDPGRLRTAWTSCTAHPYTGGPSAVIPVVVNCPDDGNDTYLAVGATFSGGAGPNVVGDLVGRAVAMECDPNLADPDDDLEQRPRIRPKRRGGRTGR